MDSSIGGRLPPPVPPSAIAPPGDRGCRVRGLAPPESIWPSNCPRAARGGPRANGLAPWPATPLANLSKRAPPSCRPLTQLIDKAARILAGPWVVSAPRDDRLATAEGFAHQRRLVEGGVFLLGVLAESTRAGGRLQLAHPATMPVKESDHVPARARPSRKIYPRRPRRLGETRPAHSGTCCPRHRCTGRVESGGRCYLYASFNGLRCRPSTVHDKVFVARSGHRWVRQTRRHHQSTGRGTSPPAQRRIDGNPPVRKAPYDLRYLAPPGDSSAWRLSWFPLLRYAVPARDEDSHSGASAERSAPCCHPGPDVAWQEELDCEVLSEICLLHSSGSRS